MIFLFVCCGSIGIRLDANTLHLLWLRSSSGLNRRGNAFFSLCIMHLNDVAYIEALVERTLRM